MGLHVVLPATTRSQRSNVSKSPKYDVPAILKAKEKSGRKPIVYTHWAMLGLKLREPSKYNGNTNFQQFAKFVVEAYRYVDDISVYYDMVHPSEQLYRLSFFLEGDADTFYWSRFETCIDRKQHPNLTLSDFFIMLFDYIFGDVFEERYGWDVDEPLETHPRRVFPSHKNAVFAIFKDTTAYCKELTTILAANEPGRKEIEYSTHLVITLGLEPREPHKYNGKPNFQQFATFVMEGFKYAKDINTFYLISHPSEQIHRLSNFLEGEANDFYWKRVQIDMDYKERLSLTPPQFFAMLFENRFGQFFSVFKQRYLRGFNQGNKTVQEYSWSLRKLFFIADKFDMPNDEREQVYTLYSGFRKSIKTHCDRSLGPDVIAASVVSWNELENEALRAEALNA